YREQGHYLERMYKWAKRVGVDEIRARIMEDVDSRANYLRRFVESQKIAQHDPWSERAKKTKHVHEFTVKPIELVETFA
nr:hypothetical protein [Gammaproteobacteria bacterium]